MHRFILCFALLPLCLATILTQQPSLPRDMALIHGATFTMGIDASEIPRYQKLFQIDHVQLFRDEIPKHSVTLASLYLDKHLVTNAQFRSFLDANPPLPPRPFSLDFDNGNFLKHWSSPGDPLAQPDHPVVNINWTSAVLYCRWAGKRLPSEAEWAYAARGGSNALFPWGDDMPDDSRANFNNTVGSTTPVGAYPPNPYGLYDMAGNVWQFLADTWMTYTLEPTDGKPKHPSFSANTPRHVIRGGSFEGAPINLWVEYRDSHPANNSQSFVGFRCAASP